MKRGAFRGLAWAALVLCTAAASPPPAPSWTTVSYLPQRQAVGLAWKQVPGGKSYQLYRKGPGEADFQLLVTVAAQQYVDTRVEYGGSYTYRLRAVGPGGPEDLGPISAETTVYAMEKESIPLPPPSWSEELTERQAGSGGGTSVLLLWNRVPGAVAFNIFRRTGAGGEFEALATVKEPQYTDRTVEAGKTYAYRVTTINAALAEGPPSEPREITVLAEAEAARVETVNTLNVVATRTVRTITGDARVPLSAPVDLAAGSDGRVYVLDNRTPGVLVFGPEGEFVTLFENRARGKALLSSPYGIAVDGEGYVWVTDRKSTSEVLRFSPAGQLVSSFPFDRPPRPETLEAVDPRNRSDKPFALDLAFLSDGRMALTDNTFHRVCFMDAKGGYLGEFGTPGSGTGSLNRPSKIAVDGQDRIWVLDSQNRLVKVFDREGRFLFEAGRAKTMVGAFLGLSGIAFPDAATVLVADSPMATVQGFAAADGAYRFHLGDEDRRADSSGMRAAWEVTTPSGLAVQQGTGRLWIGMPMIHALSVREIME